MGFTFGAKWAKWSLLGKCWMLGDCSQLVSWDWTGSWDAARLNRKRSQLSWQTLTTFLQEEPISCMFVAWKRMLRAFVNCAIVLKKRLNFFYFQWKKVDQVRSEYLRSYLNWLHNCPLKRRRRSHALKGSHSMGDGRIFLKTCRDASFNKDLSKEPNLDRIHLGGQYL